MSRNGFISVPVTNVPTNSSTAAVPPGVSSPPAVSPADAHNDTKRIQVPVSALFSLYDL